MANPTCHRIGGVGVGKSEVNVCFAPTDSHFLFYNPLFQKYNGGDKK
jgi:hypothetical protein